MTQLLRVRQLFVKWRFGEGNEGVFVQQSVSSEKVLVVGHEIPWWGMVVARLDLRIHSILLSNSRFHSLVSKYFGSKIPVGLSTEPSESDIELTREALRTSSVVALETLPKFSAVLSEMWGVMTIRLILVDHGQLISAPNGWTLCRRKKIPHGKVGGVTSSIYYIGIYFRSTNVDVTSALSGQITPIRPRRDLRAVLKMAVGGHRCGTPTPAQVYGSSIGTDVKEVRAGVVLSSGILGVKTNGGLLRLPRVKTLFGGNTWVIRALTPSKVLACWDVPKNWAISLKLMTENKRY
jgi:hypothetical protein